MVYLVVYIFCSAFLTVGVLWSSGCYVRSVVAVTVTDICKWEEPTSYWSRVYNCLNNNNKREWPYLLRSRHVTLRHIMTLNKNGTGEYCIREKSRRWMYHTETKFCSDIHKFFMLWWNKIVENRCDGRRWWCCCWYRSGVPVPVNNVGRYRSLSSSSWYSLCNSHCTTVLCPDATRW